MKPIFYSAAILLLLSACRHQKAAMASGANASNNSHTDTTWTTTHSEGNVTITTDESTTATIIITNPPDSTVTTTVDAGNPQVSTDSLPIYRLTVSFISKGAGIDMKSEEEFEKWLKEQPKHPAYETTHWGREGETNFCLKLDELSTREQEIFVRDVRTMLADKELVFVTEYAVCKGVKNQ
jgi:hypothetical protein